MDWRYVKALELRVRWIRWLESSDSKDFFKDVPTHTKKMYEFSLERGDTYFMNVNFCKLVEHARSTVPDELEWDEHWVLSPYGWMFIETGFSVPPLSLVYKMALEDKKFTMSAVSWFPNPDGGTQFLIYQDMEALNSKVDGFGPWSFFTLKNKDKVGKRIDDFESETAPSATEGAYSEFEPKKKSMLHEIRWIYSAFHLMSQKLSMVVEHRGERAIRKRFQKTNTNVSPFIRLVTLRRMEQHRKEEGKEGIVDWQWQWRVMGHWRNQWFPSEGVHKPIFIEDYIKGPEDKPLKPPTHTLFKVTR